MSSLFVHACLNDFPFFSEMFYMNFYELVIVSKEKCVYFILYSSFTPSLLIVLFRRL